MAVRALDEARPGFSAQSGQTEHVYGELRYAAKSWSRKRRIIVKAEIVRLPDREPRDNARFVITNLPVKPQKLYEDIYCQRAHIELRIKERHHGLEIDRSSCTRFWANLVARAADRGGLCVDAGAAHACRRNFVYAGAGVHLARAAAQAGRVVDLLGAPHR